MLFERLMVVLNVLKEKTTIRMAGDSVSQCGFSVVNFHKYKHFFSHFAISKTRIFILLYPIMI